MSTQLVVACTDLSKDYGDGLGLFNLNLGIAEGEVFGLIGPNGAGKSTFIKLLMDLIRSTSGSATIFGKDTRRDSLELKKVIGYLPGELMQFPNVTSGYILNLLLNLRGISDRSYLNELAGRFQLDLRRKFQDLSHGNKQKVGLIQAIMHQPRLLILDEPTLGLDPIIQRELRTCLHEYSAEGNTVILSSHVLSEVESICSRIGLINNGRLIRQGTLEELRTTRIHKVSIIINGVMPTSRELMEAGAELVEIDKQLLIFQLRGSFHSIMKLISQYEVVEFDSRELSLEEVFFSEVG